MRRDNTHRKTIKDEENFYQQFGSDEICRFYHKLAFIDALAAKFGRIIHRCTLYRLSDKMKSHNKNSQDNCLHSDT